MLPHLCKIVGVARYTNKSIRPTSIRNMKQGGATDREISTVSGHRNQASLVHYDPVVTNNTALAMADSVSNAGLPPMAKRLGLMPPPVPRINPNSQRIASQSSEEYTSPRKRKSIQTDDPEYFPSSICNESVSMGKILLRIKWIF